MMITENIDNIVYVNTEFIRNLSFDELLQFKKTHKLSLPLMSDTWYLACNKVGHITYMCEDKNMVLALKLKYGDLISD